MPKEGLSQPKEGLKKQIKRGMKTEFDSVVFYTTMTLVFIGIMVFKCSLNITCTKHHYYAYKY